MVVFPAAAPVTTPAELTDAAAGLLLVQEPPLLPLELKLILDPIHTDEPPLIVPALRTGFTVMGAEAVTVPHTVVAV